MARSIRHRNPPRKIRARDRDILQSLAHPSKHFICSLARPNESRMICEVLCQSIGESAQSEIVILFSRTNERLSADGTLIIQLARFVFGVILLLPFVVPPFKGPQVHIARCHESSQERLNLNNVSRLSCADEVVIRQSKCCQNSLKFSRIFVSECLRRNAACGRALFDFRSVLIGSR